MYNQSKKMLGDRKPESVIADAGYSRPEQIEKIENEEKVSTHVSPLPERKKGEFHYVKEKDQYTCQMGEALYLKNRRKMFEERVKDITDLVSVKGV